MEEKWFWMIYPSSSIKNNGFEWIRQNALEMGLRAEIIISDRLSLYINSNHPKGGTAPQVLLDGKACILPKIAIMRHYDSLLSKVLERHGCRVVNTTASMELSCNKIDTHLKLLEAGIPQPSTLSLTNCTKSYTLAAEIMGSPFILKSPIGSKGEQVWMVKNIEEYNFARSQCGQTILAQPFISHSKGRDVRVWVVDGAAIAAVERVASSGFKSNYSLGGSVRPFSLTNNPKAALLAKEAAGALGLEFSGVDLLFAPNNTFLVCEVNGNAGFRSITSIDDNANIPKHLFSYINQLFESIITDNLEIQNL